MLFLDSWDFFVEGFGTWSMRAQIVHLYVDILLFDSLLFSCSIFITSFDCFRTACNFCLNHSFVNSAFTSGSGVDFSKVLKNCYHFMRVGTSISFTVLVTATRLEQLCGNELCKGLGPFICRSHKELVTFRS